MLFTRSFFVILLLFSTQLFASIGSVSLLKGEAFVYRASQTIALSNGMAIEAKDTIKTSKDAQIQLIFEDKTVISLGSESDFSIEEYLNDAASPKAKFKFNQGSFKTITGKIGKIAPENFTLETKTATIGIRGTWITGRIDANGDTIGCLRGSIIVHSLRGRQTIEVFEGHKTFVGQDQDPIDPSGINKGDFDDNDFFSRRDSKKDDLAKNDYDSWGYWDKQEYQGVATTVDNTLIGGPSTPNDPNALTPVSAIQALKNINEEFTYTGTLAGTGSADSGITSSAITNSSIQLDVNFGTSSVGGTMSLVAASGNINYTGINEIILNNGSLGNGNSFTADLSQFDAQIPATGALQGNFYGANAETTAGTFSVGENTNSVTGTFNAARH